MDGKTRSIRCLALLMLVLLSATKIAFSQSPQGAFVGTVRDASGGGIPGAKVTITNELTQFQRTTVTNSEGDYSIPFADIGTYTVSVELPGFKKYINSGLVLASRETRRVDGVLEVGDVLATVTVEGQAPVIQSDTTALTASFDDIQLRRSPSYMQTGWGPTGRYIIMYKPGSGSGQANIYGSRASQVKWLVDGTEFPLYAVYPPNDAFVEVKAITVNAPAEYETSSLTDSISRGGTNTLHGFSTAVFRNPALNALPFFATGQPRPVGTPNNTYAFGGSGPVFIPKLYDGRNKTYWMATIQLQPGTSIPQFKQWSLPTDAMRGGNLSILGRPITNPATGQAFPGSIVPVNPTSAKILESIPRAADQNRIDGNLTRSLLAETSQTLSYQTKFDHQLTKNNTLTASFFFQQFTSANETALGGTVPVSVPGYGYLDDKRRHQSYTFGDTHAFSSTIVNEARFRWTRNTTSTLPRESGQDLLTRFGLTGVTSRQGNGGPCFSFGTGYTQWCPGGSSDISRNLYHFFDNLSIHRGRHRLKMGFDHAIYNSDEEALSTSTFGSFTFTGRYTGDPFGDFLLGMPTNLARENSRPVQLKRSKYYGMYFQDSFMVTPNLTLELGLRYSVSPAQSEAQGLYFNFDPKTGSIVVPDENALKAVDPAWPTSVVPIITAAQAGFPSKLTSVDGNNFAPRIGFAYRPGSGNKMVIRGAYGVYYYPLMASQSNSVYALLQTAPGPFGMLEAFEGGTTPTFQFPAPFPSNAGRVATPSVNAVEPNFVLPYKQQWNIFFEREVFGDSSVQIGYIGSADRKLGYRRNINIPPPSTIPFSQSRRPFPSLATIVALENGGSDVYGTLQVGFTRRWKNGLYVDLFYNYARQSSDVISGRFDNIGGNPIENPYDRRRDWGPSDWFNRHRTVNTVVWELPFGRGRKWGSDMSGAWDRVVGGWSVSTYSGWRSGNYMTPTYSGSDPSNTNTTSGRPDLVAGCNPYLSNPTTARWFDTSCFVVPPANAGRFGTAGRNSILGHGAYASDLGIYKEVPIRERLKLRVGAAMKTWLNHPVLGDPVVNINSPQVGQIVSAGNFNFDEYPRRNVELEAKLSW